MRHAAGGQNESDGWGGRRGLWPAKAERDEQAGKRQGGVRRQVAERVGHQLIASGKGISLLASNALELPLLRTCHHRRHCLSRLQLPGWAQPPAVLFHKVAGSRGLGAALRPSLLARHGAPARLHALEILLEAQARGRHGEAG